MAPLREYLQEHAKFYCPPVDSHQLAATGVTDNELAHVFNGWESDQTIIEARHDAQMVDALINVLNEELCESPTPGSVDGWFQQEYEQDIRSTRIIRGEPDAKQLFNLKHVYILKKIMFSLDSPFEDHPEVAAPDAGSRVDFVLTTTGGKEGLVEIKAPSVFDEAAKELFEPSNDEDDDEVGFEVQLDLDNPETGMKVIMKACVYMLLYKVEWLALTCFTKWAFLRLHVHGRHEAPYITYSTIEMQSDNTRPFRALAGMMLAIARDIDVPSNADMDGQLRPAPEPVTKAPSDGSEPPEQRDPSFKCRSQVTRAELPVTHSRGRGGNSLALSSGFLITWAPKALSNRRWFEFHAVDTDTFPALGKNTVRLCVQRNIGYGSTGFVFEAIPDGGKHNGTSERQRYAIKTVGKGETDRERGCTQRLFNELAIYRSIGQTSPAAMKIVPQCYGLFETTRTLALVMDYEGDVLSRNENWPELTRDERHKLYNTILALHRLGVYHGDLEPRNIVRGSDGSFKIIDFTSSTLHNCGQRNGCAELARVRKKLRLYDDRVQLPESRLARSSSPFHNVM